MSAYSLAANFDALTRALTSLSPRPFRLEDIEVDADALKAQAEFEARKYRPRCDDDDEGYVREPHFRISTTGSFEP